jgi:adenosylcobinamide kinase/adenosylcobinamide-phosphate guanylyltransferase
LVFVLGGARSGKSSWALRYAEERYRSLLFLATAEVGDEEMAERVRRHKASRGSGWRLLEEPLELDAAITGKCGEADAVVVDCLTVWLSNVMLKKGEGAVIPYVDRLLGALSKRKQALVVVSNEVGMGVVPPYPLGRIFRDHAGFLNQKVASMADEVYLMVAGLPVAIKR